MKKHLGYAAAALTFAACSAGGGSQATAGDVKLDTDKAKLSYAIGMDVGQSLSHTGAAIDLNAFNAGVAAMVNGEKPKLSAKEAQAAKQAFFRRQQKQAMEKRKELGMKNRTEGEKFLAGNAKKPDVKTTASGLQYQVLKMGDGPKPKATDRVKVNYEGRLIDGTVFDSSYKRGQPVTFPLNRVIKGWTEGLQLMPVGSKFRLFLPPELAYGERGAGSAIGPNATLIFDVELLGIEQ